MKTDRKKLNVGDAKAVQDLFGKEGLKLTHQRLEIYRELMAAKDHPSAEDVFQRVRPRIPTVSLDTVYRTLDMFERIGVVAKVEVLDDRSRFDPNREPHHHLVCTVCRKVDDFPCPAVDSISPPPQAEIWGKIAGRHLELRGICNECLSKQAAK
ncbi:MAG: transcriptional repressor [PVC group bacterium]